MKSLKITKGQSETVNQRRTENEMAKRKRTNIDLQNTTQGENIKTEQLELH